MNSAGSIRGTPGAMKRAAYFLLTLQLVQKCNVGGYALSDFASGTLLPTPIGNSTFGVKTLPLAQLQGFPAPRFAVSPAQGGGNGHFGDSV